MYSTIGQVQERLERAFHSEAGAILDPQLNLNPLLTLVLGKLPAEMGPAEVS